MRIIFADTDEIEKQINLHKMEYDLAIIGGGPAGYSAAERAAGSGLNTVLFEKKALGGVCLNEGCIPTKALLYSAKVLDKIRHASRYGILNEGLPSFDIEKILSRKNKIVKRLTSGVKARLLNAGVNLVSGEASIRKHSPERIILDCEGVRYEAKYLLLCTGSDTVIPSVKGLKETDYWTSREALEFSELPESLAIIGGGVVGIEFASFFNSLGVKVSVVEMMPEILGEMDKEISAMLRNNYVKRGVDFYLSSKVTEVSGTEISMEKDGKAEKISAEKILLSVGRHALVKACGLENTGVEILKTGLKVNEYMQTSCDNIYAAGDVTGFSMLAHTAVREAEVAVNHILGKKDKMSYAAIPGVVYTNPEIAGVGKTEEQLSAEGKSFRVLKLPMAYSGRFVAENEGVNGLCKILADEEGRIVGCHILGNPASEIILAAGIAVSDGDNVEKFKKYIYPHPTVGEIIKETLNSY